MIDKRQTIRRSFTGGIALGFFAGVFMSIPDILTAFILQHILNSASLLILAFYLSFGILSGGTFGLLFGISIKAAESISPNRKKRFLLQKKWLMTLISISFIYLIAKSHLFFGFKLIIFIILLILSWFLIDFIMKYSIKIVTSNNFFKSYIYIISFITVGLLLSWSYLFESLNVSEIPFLMIFYSALFLNFAFFLIFNLLRYKAKHTLGGRMKFTFLATPKFTIFLLILSTISITWFKINKETKRISVTASSPLISSLIYNKNTVQPNTNKKITHNQKTKFFSIPKFSSIVIITQNGGHFTQSESAWKNNKTVLPSSNDEDILGTLFFSQHIPLRKQIAPFIAAQLPSIPLYLKFKRKYQLYSFSNIKIYPSSYYREAPFFGFEQPILIKNTEIQDFTTTSKLFKSSYIAWLNLKNFQGNLNNVISSLNKQNVYVIYIYWDEKSNFAKVTISGNTIPNVENNSFYPMDDLLSSLLRIPSKFTDQPSFKFPPTRKIALRIDNNSYKVYSENGKFLKSYKKLQYKIRKKLNKLIYPAHYLSLSSLKQKMILKLDQLICKGSLNKQEEKFLGYLKSNPYLDVQIKKRVILLNYRVSKQIKQNKSFSILVYNAVTHLFYNLKNNKYTTSDFFDLWTYYLVTDYKSPELLQYCPGL